LEMGTFQGGRSTSLMLAGAKGIVGNELFDDRTVGYFPRRSLLCL
jgi:hypothetical protein